MKKILLNIGGIIIFYSIIIVGVLLLNLRFYYLNNVNASFDITETMNN